MGGAAGRGLGVEGVGGGRPLQVGRVKGQGTVLSPLHLPAVFFQ